jgi:phage-related protein
MSTWAEAVLDRDSVAYTSFGKKVPKNIPRFDWIKHPNAIWSDTFSSASTLSNYVSGGDTIGSWLVLAGNLAATGNKSTLIKKDLAIGDVQIDVISSQAEHAGLILRYQDNDNYYLLEIGDDVSGMSTNFILWKRVNGNFGRLALADVTWGSGSQKTIGFRACGKRLEVFFSGLKVISIEDPEFVSGKVGFYQDTSSNNLIFSECNVYHVIPGILAEDYGLNMFNYSEDFTQAITWVRFGNPNPTADQRIAPDGTLTADLIGDFDNVNYSGVAQTVAIDNDNAWYCASIFVKKDTNEVRMPAFELELTGGATPVSLMIWLNTKTGEITNHANAICEGVEDYWKVSVSLRNNTSGNNSLVYRVYPARGTTIGGNDPTISLTYIYAWGAYLTKTYSPSTYIKASVSRDNDMLKIPSSLINRSEFDIEMIFCPTMDQGEVSNVLFEYYIDNDNYIRLSTIATGELNLEYKAPGVATVTKTQWTKLVTRASYSIKFGVNHGIMTMFKNGVEVGSGMSVEPLVGSCSYAYLGSNYNGSYAARGLIGNVRIGKPRAMTTQYSNAKPLKFDNSTTALLGFAGDLRYYTKKFYITLDDYGSYELQPLGGKILKESVFPIIPEWQKYTEKIPAFHGEIDFGGVYGNRDMSLVMRIPVDNYLKHKLIRELSSLISPLDGYVELIFDVEPEKVYLVRVSSASYSEMVQQIKVKMDFDCKPFLDSVYLNNLYFSSEAVYNQGNFETPCVVTFFDACTNPSITINGITTIWTGTLVNGEKLEIDAGNMTCRKYSAGSWVNALSGLSAFYPKLQPGRNEISTSFFAVIQWRDRWL